MFVLEWKADWMQPEGEMRFEHLLEQELASVRVRSLLAGRLPSGIEFPELSLRLARRAQTEPERRFKAEFAAARSQVSAQPTADADRVKQPDQTD